MNIEKLRALLNAAQLLKENEQLRAELDARTYHDDRDSIIAGLEADLEALKPKPVRETDGMHVYWDANEGCTLVDDSKPNNVRLTFLGGKLVSAEVIG